MARRPCPASRQGASSCSSAAAAVAASVTSTSIRPARAAPTIEPRLRRARGDRDHGARVAQLRRRHAEQPFLRVEGRRFALDVEVARDHVAHGVAQVDASRDHVSGTRLPRTRRRADADERRLELVPQAEAATDLAIRQERAAQLGGRQRGGVDEVHVGAAGVGDAARDLVRLEPHVDLVEPGDRRHEADTPQRWEPARSARSPTSSPPTRSPSRRPGGARAARSRRLRGRQGPAARRAEESGRRRPVAARAPARAAPRGRRRRAAAGSRSGRSPVRARAGASATPWTARSRAGRRSAAARDDPGSRAPRPPAARRLRRLPRREDLRKLCAAQFPMVAHPLATLVFWTDVQ